MELQLDYIKGQMEHRLFLDGQKTRYRDVEAEIKARHWIVAEIEKLIGLNKGVRIIVEDLETSAEDADK